MFRLITTVRRGTAIVGNDFQMLGYAMRTVAGLFIAASLLSLGFRPDNTSVETTATLGALGVTLALCAVWGGLRAAHAVAPLLCNQKTPAGPRDGA
jgi:hypothetical protein